MSTAYWPWWVGAVALAGVNVGFWWCLGRSLGVSGHWRMATQFLANRRLDQLEKPFLEDPNALQAAIERATCEQFGPRSLGAAAAAPAGPDHPGPGATAASAATRVPWGAHIIFLLMILAGGYLAQSLRGPVELHAGTYAGLRELIGTGWASVSLLGLGGFLVGFGARMAGGCPTWHGLSGCARLRWPSMLATACFFGGAVAVSFLLAWLAS